MERYEIISLIGGGTYGQVYKAKDKVTSENLAVKRITLEATDETGIPSTAIREVSLLQQLRHPNIVQLIDVIHTEKRLALVFEYVQRDLQQCIDACGREGLEPFTVKSFLFQMLQGLAFCHRHRILHRDMKPHNLLIDNSGVLKIADFGLARPFGITPRLYSTEVVTLWYRAPELLSGSPAYSPAIDVWSVGCIFAEMVNGAPLFPGADEADQLMRVFSTLGAPSKSDAERLGGLDLSKYEKLEAKTLAELSPRLDAVGLDLLGALLQVNPDKRVSAQAALSHAFFKDLKLKRVR